MIEMPGSRRIPVVLLLALMALGMVIGLVAGVTISSGEVPFIHVKVPFALRLPEKPGPEPAPEAGATMEEALPGATGMVPAPSDNNTAAELTPPAPTLGATAAPPPPETAPGATAAPPPHPAPLQPPEKSQEEKDRLAITNVIYAYYDALSRHNLEESKQCWFSPDAGTEKRIQAAIAKLTKVEILSLSISDVTGASATARAQLKITYPKKVVQTMDKTFRLLKTEGVWKIQLTIP